MFNANVFNAIRWSACMSQSSLETGVDLFGRAPPPPPVYRRYSKECRGYEVMRIPVVVSIYLGEKMVRGTDVTVPYLP